MMMKGGIAVASLALLGGLGGCVIVEGLAQGLGAIAAENEQQPRFAYTLRRVGADTIFISVLTVEDEAYVERAIVAPVSNTELYLADVSPNGRQILVGYVEYIGLSDLDIGVFSVDMLSEEVGVFVTDITAAGRIERGCDLSGLGQSAFDEFIEFAFEDPVEAAAITFEVVSLDVSDNMVWTRGWISDDAVALMYQGLWQVVVRDAGGREIERIELGESQFGLRSDRVGDRWETSPLCAEPQPAVMPPVPDLRDLRISERMILLDGDRLQDRLMRGLPFENREVWSIAGPFEAP